MLRENNPSKGGNVQLIVITHNGLPPSEGGRRIGMQGGGKVFYHGGPPAGVSVEKLVKTRGKTLPEQLVLLGNTKVVPESRKLRSFSSIPMSSYRWEKECPKCKTCYCRTVTIATDEGERVVHKCDCGQLFRVS